MQYNAEHPLFAPLNDSILGIRTNGGYWSIFEDEDQDRKHFIFDNGAHFVFELQDRILYHVENINSDYFIHKYIEPV